MEKDAILVADAGSTKVDWALIPREGDPIRFRTSGMNAVMASEKDLKVFFCEAASQCDGYNISGIYYYGAGCTGKAIHAISDAIRSIWPKAQITVDSDLVGAAISLFGKEEGIACILGTGSNTGLYQQNCISSNIPPLGYILGDEGSGAALGKRFIKEIFKGEIDPRLKKAFFDEYSLSKDEIIRRVYRQPAANKFLASLVPFIRKHIENPLLEQMVNDEFREFFRRNVAPYPNALSLPLAFTGSVAFHFEPWLRKVAEEEGFHITRISKSPIDGLIRFYQ